MKSSTFCGTAQLMFVALALLAVPGLGSGADAAAGDRPPNIVFLLADDLGYGDVRCYNPHSKIPTPNIDRLAAEGIRLTDAHTPSGVCTPTRYGVLTGRYCWRTRLKSNVLMGFDAPLIEPGRMTVAGLLKGHGYATACIGKWHLGMTFTKRDGSEVSERERIRDGSLIDFSVPIKKLAQMIEDMDESFLITDSWKKVSRRIEKRK